MFQHVATLLSFIFAIALTHVFASASELIQAGRRVRFDGLLASWMFIACFALVVNWIGLLGLQSLKHWSLGQVILQLGWAVPQYFTCSLVSIKVPESGHVDMKAFYEKQRPKLFSAFIVLYAAAMIENFCDRNNTEEWAPGDWIGANLLVLPMLIAALVAGWAKPRFLQWSAVCLTVALQAWFLISYGTWS